jgi:hypothetical protein
MGGSKEKAILQFTTLPAEPFGQVESVSGLSQAELSKGSGENESRAEYVNKSDQMSKEGSDSERPSHHWRWFRRP